jgi:hypothetical protein
MAKLISSSQPTTHPSSRRCVVAPSTVVYSEPVLIHFNGESVHAKGFVITGEYMAPVHCEIGIMVEAPNAIWSPSPTEPLWGDYYVAVKVTSSKYHGTKYGIAFEHRGTVYDYVVETFDPLHFGDIPFYPELIAEAK